MLIANGLRVTEFKTEYRVGRDPVDWVEIAPSGAAFEKVRTWHRVAKVMPPENVNDREKGTEKYQDLVAKWNVIGPAYEAWKSGQDIPEDGTPLAAWSGLTGAQADFLRRMGIKTVEDVAEMGDGALRECKWPNARSMPALAKKWLEGEAVATKDAHILELEERLAAMQEVLEEQGKPKRGPGRPKKEPAEA